MKKLLLGVVTLSLIVGLVGCSDRKRKFSGATDVSGLSTGIWDESEYENCVWGE